MYILIYYYSVYPEAVLFNQQRRAAIAGPDVTKGPYITSTIQKRHTKGNDDQRLVMQVWHNGYNEGENLYFINEYRASYEIER